MSVHATVNAVPSNILVLRSKAGLEHTLQGFIPIDIRQLIRNDIKVTSRALRTMRSRRGGQFYSVRTSSNMVYSDIYGFTCSNEVK